MNREVKVDTPEILEAYERVRSDKDETNWLLLSNASGKDKELTLTATGSGGLDELTSRFDEGQGQFGYVRVEYANDSESTRVKFVLVVWIGREVRGMRMRGVINETNEVKRVLSHFSFDIKTDDKAELKTADVVQKLRRAGGADYNGGRG
ncbi:hypothetical protein GGTG_03843 [Gaeumannomyces tritici R3-111a-1]|uniref:ADF-H domain-containing protein n=1 Tax=Gaeumannomyces tritici (strain R3-111a-1) TaxID=644352 RepID=J3NRD9_GAET3|nr:hypothetical protein GGTG_03843 [Gaeumannomyces tritici R3-111a-1]EJT78745.1 hypothetical protein GGTG_03843 [Gaeumannomyces tritici R3-111a-1]